jgi:hypothetical protein
MSDQIEIPELIETWKIAQAMRWPSKKMTNFLREAGMATRPCQHNYLVFREDLEATMPRVYRIFVDRYRAGEISTKRHRAPRRIELCGKTSAEE